MSTATLKRAAPRCATGLAAAALLACTVRAVPGDSSSDTGDPVTTTSTTSTPTSTSGASSTAPIPTSDPPDPASTSTAGDSTLVVKIDFVEPTQCDGLKQIDPECPPGQKCTIDESLGATHCVDVVDDPKGMYEPCTMTGNGWSGFDDCDFGLLCWNVDARGHGTCIGLCDGDYNLCLCVDPSASAAFCQDCAVGLCIPGCDPLLQDCVGSDLCIPNGDHFLCVLDASGDAGAANDPCEFANSCDKGLYCIPPAMASSACMQDAPGCCQPFCDLMQMLPCPNPDQACVPWFDPRMPVPPDFKNLGICAIP